MNSLLSHITASILLKSARSILGTTSSTFCGSCSSSNLSLKRSFNHPLVNSICLSSSSSVFSRFGAIHCYSSKRKSPTKRKSKPEPEPVVEDGKEMEKDAFFVVRKGDVVGVYKTLSECQAQISDPPVSVYKGYSLPKDDEEYLASRGLHNALYTIKASDLKDDLFGTLVPCPFLEPTSSKGETSSVDLPQKRPHDVLGTGNVGDVGTSTDPLSKLQKLDSVPSDTQSCILHFDGASKGNPGQAGAGAVLRTLNGSLICRIRQGLGTATCNAAEYRAVILGLKKALEMGYTNIQAQGDSKLVCMQLQGLWKVKNENMSTLHAEAKLLINKFTSFKISHVLREFNSDADAQANFAVSLADGQVQEVFS
uniref:RNase H type-1 domain-containing protein n=1 Tax=Chenopodium quinoa TaxID=63459 RepID=A0A803MBW5_CHEQI